MGGDALKVIGEKDDIFGFCMAFSADILKEVGYFDTQFSLGYYEDTDFEKRIRKAGFSIVVDRSTFVEHGGVTGASVSMGQYKRQATEAKIKNALRYAWKYRPGGFIEVPKKLCSGILQGRDIHSVTAEIIQSAKEKCLWEEYLVMNLSERCYV